MNSVNVTISSLPSAPAPSPAQNAPAGSPDAPTASGHFDSHMQESPAPANGGRAQARNDNASDAPKTGNSQNDQKPFSKLLSSRQSATPSSPARTSSAQSASDTADSSPTDSASNATAAVIALLLQIQAPATPKTSSTPDDAATQAVSDLLDAVAPSASDANPTSASNGKDAIDQLLKQLLALLGKAQQANTASDDTGTTTNTADAAPQPSDPTPKDTSLSDLAALIQSLLQQGSQTPAQSQAATSTAATDDLAISGDTTSATSLTAALNQLATLLGQASKDAKAPASSEAPLPAFKLANAAKDTGTQDAATAPASDPAPAPSLQQAIAHVIDALAGKDADTLPPRKSDADINSSLQAIAPAQPQAPHAPASSDFARQIQQAAAPQAPVQDQVVVQIKNAISDGSSQIRIQLHPEDLGKVDVQLVTTSDGKTGVTITADNRNTLAMLQNEARSLQDALRDIGLKTDAGDLNFNLRDSGQDARNSSKQQQGGYTKVASVAGIDDDTGFSTAGSLYRMSVQQGLDIRV